MQLRARLEEAGYIKNWFLALVSKIGFIKKTRRAYAWNLVFFLKKSISCFFRCTKANILLLILNVTGSIISFIFLCCQF
jgi:hypothetical protein